MNELLLGNTSISKDESIQTVKMANETWRVSHRFKQAGNSSLQEVTVTVSTEAQPTETLTTLRGFVNGGGL